MIFGKSNDPVIVHKIALRIWKLRDEVESVIRTRLAEVAFSKSEEENDDDLGIEDLQREYNFHSQENDAFISDVVEEGDAGMDEMAMAMDQMDGGEEQSEGALESEEEVEEGSASEEELIEAQEEDQLEEGEEIVEEIINDDEVDHVIFQRIPDLEEDKIASGKTILNEVSMDGIYFFSDKLFIPGQSIVIEFLIPNHFLMNAEVLDCRPFNMKSRIISVNKMTQRVRAKFTFLKKGERTLLRKFVQSVEPDLTLYAKENLAKNKAKESDEEGDDFGDLDDL